MFELKSRRYTGAKTRLLKQIDGVFLKHLKHLKDTQNLSFFDVFAGTGVVSAYFLEHYTRDKSINFTHFYINDFLHSNFAIYQGFFSQENFSQTKLNRLAKHYNELKNLKANFYTKAYGGCFFSEDDATLLGFIREDLSACLKAGELTQKEFFVLLTSLIYSADKVANTVGHYDAYRKGIRLENRLKFELIKPFKTKAKIEIFKNDSNALAQNFAKKRKKIDIAFIDPPYNSRQYARFYHLLESLAKHDKPTLYGVAKKPKPELISAYCKSEAKEAFENLVQSLAKCTKILLITYNNTISANPRSNTRMNAEQITQILQKVGKVSVYDFDFKAFSSGKTDFKAHKEMIFVCEI